MSYRRDAVSTHPPDCPGTMCCRCVSVLQLCRFTASQASPGVPMFQCPTHGEGPLCMCQCFSRCRTLLFEAFCSLHVSVFQPLRDSALGSARLTACVSVSAAAKLCTLKHFAPCMGQCFSCYRTALGSARLAACVSVSAATGRLLLGVPGSLHVSVFQPLQDSAL